jgi:hypothetical protein
LCEEPKHKKRHSDIAYGSLYFSRSILLDALKVEFYI